MNPEFEQLKDFIESSTEKMIELQTLLTSIPALAPENDGEGEIKKAEALEKWLIKNGIKNIKHYDAPDERVPSKIRPNVIAEIPGAKDDYAIWVMAHLDVVPPGDISMWNTDPWTVVEKDGKLYGRGVEDDQQGLVSGVFAALAFVQQHIIPEHTIKLLFMADEEVGSRYGMGYLLENHRELFKEKDLILIPDGGDPEGKTIEIAEKNMLWLKFHTIGKQIHASRPDEGINAFLANCELALQMHALEKVFNARDEIFEPPYTTITPTMKTNNVSAVNIVPGDDVFFVDCRILPCYSLDEVREEVHDAVSKVELKYGVKIEITEVNSSESPATKKDAPVVKSLSEAIKAVHGIETKTIGIGGGTVGAELRRCGIECAVWSTLDETCHQANEYCTIKGLVADALTVAYMAMSD